MTETVEVHTDATMLTADSRRGRRIDAGLRSSGVQNRIALRRKDGKVMSRKIGVPPLRSRQTIELRHIAQSFQQSRQLSRAARPLIRILLQALEHDSLQTRVDRQFRSLRRRGRCLLHMRQGNRGRSMFVEDQLTRQQIVGDATQAMLSLVVV